MFLFSFFKLFCYKYYAKYIKMYKILLILNKKVKIL